MKAVASGMFSIRDGIPPHEALQQASCFLESAQSIVFSKECDTYAVGCLIEMAKALVDAATKMPGDDNAAITAASSVGAGKPEPIMSTTVHILAVDLGRAHRAMRRLQRKMKRALEIAEG